MIQAYDLFKEDERGTRIFVETVIGMHQAKKRLMKLTSLKPGKYRIYDPTEARFVEPFIVPVRLNSTAKRLPASTDFRVAPCGVLRFSLVP